MMAYDTKDIRNGDIYIFIHDDDGDRLQIVTTTSRIPNTVMVIMIDDHYNPIDTRSYCYSLKSLKLHWKRELRDEV